MKLELYALICSMVSLAACGQPTDQNSKNEAATNAAQPQKKPAYCFFKTEEMKGWKVSRDSHGDITVDGEAHVEDPRYKASFGKIEVGPVKAILVTTISQNDLGYAMRDNWWHLSTIVPNSASLNEATVKCGDKIVADLKLAPKG